MLTLSVALGVAGCDDGGGGSGVRVPPPAAPVFGAAGPVSITFTALAAAAADLDYDGEADLVVGGAGVLRTYRGLGGGAFAPLSDAAIDGVDARIRGLVAAQLDGAGGPDLALAAELHPASRTLLPPDEELGQIAEGFPNTSRMGSSLLTARMASGVTEGLLRFPIESSIPSDAVVTRAALSLFHLNPAIAPSDPGTLDVFANVRESPQLATTWASWYDPQLPFPRATSASASIPVNDGLASVTRTADIADLVAEWASGARPNFGLTVKKLPAVANTDLNIRSGKLTAFEYRPRLEVGLLHAQNLLLANDGSPRFAQPATMNARVRAVSSVAIVAAELAGPPGGLPDLLIVNDGAPPELLENLGGGAFADRSSLVGTGALDGTCACAADFDGDGTVDAFIGVRGGPAVLLSRMNGAFHDTSARLPAAAFDVRVCVAAPIAGDAAPDILAATGDPASPLVLLVNDGAGRFVASTSHLPAVPAEPTAAAVADLNDDGLADIAIADGSGLPVLLLRDLRGHFHDASGALSGAIAGARVVVAADLDGDGRTDLFFAGSAETSVLLQR